MFLNRQCCKVTQRELMFVTICVLEYGGMFDKSHITMTFSKAPGNIIIYSKKDFVKGKVALNLSITVPKGSIITIIQVFAFVTLVLTIGVSNALLTQVFGNTRLISSRYTGRLEKIGSS